MSIWVMPYNIGSKSARALADALETKRVNKNNTALKGSPKKTLINWGNSLVDHPELVKCNILNKPEAVHNTANKLSFFRMFKDDYKNIIPPFTTDKNEVAKWLNDDNKAIVVARTVLNGHSGEGIRMINLLSAGQEGIPNAPLFTKYVPKKDEYRVHFSRKTGIFFKQRKAMVAGTENPNWKIRNLAGGFIYANQDVQTPEAVDKVAEMFYNDLEAGGLDFGALDIIYNERSDKAYILEVNTAPGLAGRTLEAYTNMLRNYIT